MSIVAAIMNGQTLSLTHELRLLCETTQSIWNTSAIEMQWPSEWAISVFLFVFNEHNIRKTTAKMEPRLCSVPVRSSTLLHIYAHSAC